MVRALTHYTKELGVQSPVKKTYLGYKFIPSPRWSGHVGRQPVEVSLEIKESKINYKICFCRCF